MAGPPVERRGNTKESFHAGRGNKDDVELHSRAEDTGEGFLHSDDQARIVRGRAAQAQSHRKFRRIVVMHANEISFFFLGILRLKKLISFACITTIRRNFRWLCACAARPRTIRAWSSLCKKPSPVSSARECSSTSSLLPRPAWNDSFVLPRRSTGGPAIDESWIDQVGFPDRQLSEVFAADDQN